MVLYGSSTYTGGFCMEVAHTQEGLPWHNTMAVCFDIAMPTVYSFFFILSCTRVKRVPSPVLHSVGQEWNATPQRTCNIPKGAGGMFHACSVMLVSFTEQYPA